MGSSASGKSAAGARLLRARMDARRLKDPALEKHDARAAALYARFLQNFHECVLKPLDFCTLECSSSQRGVGRGSLLCWLPVFWVFESTQNTVLGGREGVFSRRNDETQQSQAKTEHFLLAIWAPFFF